MSRDAETDEEGDGREDKTSGRCSRLIGADRHYHRLQNSEAPVSHSAVSRCLCVSLGLDVSCARGVRATG